MKIVAIEGSPRLNGNTSYLTDLVLKGAASRGIETERIILNSLNIHPCQNHDDCRSRTSCFWEDDAAQVLDSFAAADGVILSSPVHWDNVSAQMKLFIDRCIFLRRHNEKPRARAIGLIAVGNSSGTNETVAALKRFIAQLDALSPDKVVSVVGYAKGAGGIKGNEAMINQARKLGATMAQTLLT